MFEGITTTALLIYVSLLVIALIGLTLLILLVYSGVFQPVDEVGTSKPPIGRMIVAYKFQKGSYSAAGPIFTEAAIIAPDNKAIGIYYDDPDKVDSSETRFVVGSVLSEDSAPANEDMVKKFTDKEFKILHLPEVAFAVQTKFPHITTLSILIGVHKAYPRLKEYIEEHKLSAYPFIELYDGKTIRFMAPLSKQEDFFVPECKHIPVMDQDSSNEGRALLSTSLSNTGESNNSQDFNKTSEVDPAAEDIQETDQKDSTRSETISDDKIDDEETNDNNSALETNDEDKSNDDEQASDDSSSSFEVLNKVEKLIQ